MLAYFGQKDAQQALVIRKLVRDLDIPVRIEVCPTIRDGRPGAELAERVPERRGARARARAERALRAAEAVVAGGERDAGAVVAAARELDRAASSPITFSCAQRRTFRRSSA